VHEESDDEISFHNRQHDEDNHQYILRNRGKGDTYFKDGYDQQDPECSPDNRTIFGIIMFRNKLIVDIPGIVSVGMRGMVIGCHKVVSAS
jgi:hypothetical protein